MQGKFILLIGPSGSGKGTLIHHARTVFPNLAYPRSTTTRTMRPGEKSGEHYLFVSKEEFQKNIESGAFLEWAEYGGHYYGTPLSEVQPFLKADKVGLKELEVQGARQIREKLPREELVIIFVNAGTWDEMEERIRLRADMPGDELQKRKERYQDEMTFMKEADFVVQNPRGEAERAMKQFEDIIRSLT